VRILEVLLIPVLCLSSIVAAQTTTGDKKPQPLPGHTSAFSVQIKGPYRDLSAVIDDKEEQSVKKGEFFDVKLVLTNTADRSVLVPEFTSNTGSVWDIRDSSGKLAMVDRCTKPPKSSPSQRVSLLPEERPLKKGEQNDSYFVWFGDPDQSCFETDVPGTYTLQLHVPDPYTGTVVDSNKLTIKVTK
jgi:hypothetical protein